MASRTIPQVVPFPKGSTGVPDAEAAHPVERPSHFRTQRKKMVHLTAEELLAVLKLARSRSVRDWTMILLAYRHGLRASEVCELKMTDVDVKAGSLLIRRLKGSLHTVQPLYRHKGQPLLDELATLRAWVRERQADGSDYLFLSQKGGRLHRSQFFSVFKSTRKRLACPWQSAIRTH